MEARLKDTETLLPGAQEGIQQLVKAIYSGGAPPKVLELVHLRASQINGCSVCVWGGVDSAQKHGETVDRLLHVSAWREAPDFTDAERAALALAEAETRLADRPDAVTDEIWAEAARHYNEKALGAIVMMIAMTNLFNRVNTTLRVPAGATWA